MSASHLEDRAANPRSLHALLLRAGQWRDRGRGRLLHGRRDPQEPGHDISGRDEIRAFAGRFATQRAEGTQFRHMVSNIAVTITGHRAAASAYLLVLISKDGTHRSLPPGRYACELIKEDTGQWRFARRTVFHDHD